MEKFRLSDPRYNKSGWLLLNNPLTGQRVIGGNHFITDKHFDHKIDNLLYLHCSVTTLADTPDWPPIARSNRT